MATNSNEDLVKIKIETPISDEVMIHFLQELSKLNAEIQISFTTGSYITIRPEMVSIHNEEIVDIESRT